MKEYEQRTKKDMDDIRVFKEEVNPYAKIRVLRTFNPIFKQHDKILFDEVVKCADPRVTLAAYVRYPLDITKKLGIGGVRRCLDLFFEADFIKNTDPSLRHDILYNISSMCDTSGVIKELLPRLFDDTDSIIKGQALILAYNLKEDSIIQDKLPSLINDSEPLLSTPAREIYMLLSLETNKTRNILFELMTAFLSGPIGDDKSSLRIVVEPEILLGKRLAERSYISLLQFAGGHSRKILYYPRIFMAGNAVVLRLNNLDARVILENRNRIISVYCGICTKTHNDLKYGSYTHVHNDTIFRSAATQITYQTIECPFGHHILCVG